jgi:hypothetical protein
MHGAHLARGELVLILLHGEGHDHVQDESNLRLSKLHLTAYCAVAHRDHSSVHLCDNELRQLCAVLQSAELLDDHHLGTNDRYLDDHDLLEDDPLNHHDHTTDDHRDLLTDDRDLGHHFVHTQDDLLDDYLDGPDAHYDCPKDGHYLDGHGLRLACLNDHLHRLDGRDAMVCRILLPVADDVDRDFLGLALDEVYLQTTRKRRTYAICD